MSQSNEFILTGYDLIQTLHGGMADVYICKPELLWGGRLVAIKTLQSDFLADARHRTLFVRECHTWSLLGQHENLVGFLGIHLVQGSRPLLILEYVESNLRQLLQEQSQLPIEIVLKIALNICDAMNYCSEIVPDIVHSDLKPQNIMITSDLRAKVTDFGLVRCRLTSRSATEHGPTAFPDSTKTRQEPSHGAGTALYMSPEQFRGIALDAASDVYSFGCILYELLTSKPLHLSRSRQQLQKSNLMQDLPLSQNRDKLAELIESCVRTNPKERPSFAELRKDLGLVAKLECNLTVPVPKGSPNAADFNVIMALIKLGDLDNAEKICLQGSSSDFPELDPPLTAFLLGQIARRRGQATQAISYFKQALELDDSKHESMKAWIMDNLAQAYKQVGDSKNSIKASEEAIKAQPGIAVPWHNLGLTYRDVGQIDDALRCFKEARRLSGDPVHFAAVANLLSVARHDWRAALSELRIAMNSHSNVPDLHLEYARALIIGFSQLIQQDKLITPERVAMVREADQNLHLALNLGISDEAAAGLREAVEGMSRILDKRSY